MKGLIKRVLAVAALGTGLSALGGCTLYRHFVDPSYPERYEYEARQSVESAFGAQANNGHALEQTVWAWHFEKGTDKLTIGGQEHLAQLARRRPQPDPKIYLETAYDIPIDQAAPEKFVTAQTELNGRRAQAVQRYLGAVTASRPVNWEVAVHDPGERGLAAQAVGAYTRGLLTNIGKFQNSMPAFSGGSSIIGGSGGSR